MRTGMGPVWGVVAVMGMVGVAGTGIGMDGVEGAGVGGSEVEVEVVNSTIAASRSFTRSNWYKSFSMQTGLMRRKSCSPGWKGTRRCF